MDILRILSGVGPVSDPRTRTRQHVESTCVKLAPRLIQNIKMTLLFVCARFVLVCAVKIIVCAGKDFE